MLSSLTSSPHSILTHFSHFIQVPQLTLPVLSRGGGWHWIEELTGSSLAGQPQVVFENHGTCPWLPGSPNTICCSSVIIISRYCACLAGPSPTTLHCSCPPPWHQKRAHLDSRNKSILVCVIPTNDKNNINSNNKYLVSGCHYSFNCWSFHSWPWWDMP